MILLINGIIILSLFHFYTSITILARGRLNEKMQIAGSHLDHLQWAQKQFYIDSDMR